MVKEIQAVEKAQWKVTLFPCSMLSPGVATANDFSLPVFFTSFLALTMVWIIYLLVYLHIFYILIRVYISRR